MYDHNKVAMPSFVAPILADPVASQYVDGIALHWYDYFTTIGVTEVDQVVAMAGDRFVLATEACWIAYVNHTWPVVRVCGRAGADACAEAGSGVAVL